MTARRRRPSGAAWSSRMWLALSSPRFRMLAGGQLVSNIGDGMYAVALPWYVLSQHGSPILLGTVLAAYGIPRTCLIMVGGHLADRFRPWTVMMGADIGRLALVGALAVLAATTPPDMATLVPIAFGLGAGQGLFLPASFAIMPRIVTGSQLQSGNALLSASTQVASFAGPALGGLVVAAVSSAAGFGLDSVSFAISALTLWRLGSRARTSETASRARASLAEPSGQEQQKPERLWAFIRRERVIPLLMVINIAGNLGSAGTDLVALPVFARGHLQAGAGGYGALIASFGIGALAGSLLAAQMKPRKRPALTAGLMFLLQAPLIAGLAIAPGLAVAAAIMTAWGILNMWANVTTQTAFQRWAPQALMGRLSGILLTTSYGMFPVSVALAGFVVHRFGPGAFFIIAAATLVAAEAWALSHRAFRDFGIRPDPQPAGTAGPAAPRSSKTPAAGTAGARC
jgi:predicted MFS family arabinose efflux permease